MKAFKLSDFTHRRRELMKALEKGPVTLQHMNTNGKVLQEYVLTKKESGNV